METKLHEINVTLSHFQKEDIFFAFINREKISLYLNNDALYGNDTLLVPEKRIAWNSINEETSESFVCKETFSQMFDNNFRLLPSTDEKGLKHLRLYAPATVVERLEQAREDNIERFKFILDYSLLNTTPFSKKYSVFKNVGKIMENIPSSEI